MTEPDFCENKIGLGIHSIINNRNIYIGSPKYISQILPEIDGLEDNNNYQEMINEGYTSLFIAIDNELIGLISLFDKLQDDIKKVIDLLHKEKFEIHICSGDRYETINHVAKELNIEHFKGSMSSEDKATYIKELKLKNKKVMFLGDGLNDSLALIQSNIGVSVSRGTDLTKDVAMIVLLKAELIHLFIALDLAKTAFRRIKYNFFWAFVYNVVCIPIAAGVLYPFFQIRIPPIVAGLLMSSSSISVVLSSLYLKRYKNKLI